jgi:transposase-like protein
MSDLMIDIEEMLRDGYSIEEVAKQFGVPFEWVKQVHYAMDHSDGVGECSPT